MLIYRKINQETARELMQEPNLSLPADLLEYVKQANVKIEEEERKEEVQEVQEV